MKLVGFGRKLDKLASLQELPLEEEGDWRKEAHELGTGPVHALISPTPTYCFAFFAARVEPL